LKENVVDNLLMGSGDGSKFFRNGESDQEVFTGQKALLLIVEPFISEVVLAFRAVPVLTGMKAVMKLCALFTGIEIAAERLGAAVDDVLNDLAMRRRHPIAEFCDVLRSM
jgi:hypothetical protein